MTVLYNELDHYPTRWLRNLSAAGLIAEGSVDERSIEELEPDVVAEASQFHAFAGIGAWSYALRLAGVPDDAPIWTGSCPCQPFSSAGKGGGFGDPRHLWPAWFRLIRECRPVLLFGEQSASPLGRAWLDLVSTDLEGVGYAVGAADLCAASIGAPHIRQRLYFVAYAEAVGRTGEHLRGDRTQAQRTPEIRSPCLLGHPGSEGSGRHPGTVPGEERKGEGGRSSARDLAHEPELAGETSGVGEPNGSGPLARGEAAETVGHRSSALATGGATRGFWHPADWLPCSDGKLRPVEPGTFPLAHGAPARVGRLRAYGNAIVPEVAAEFVRAALEAIP